MKKLTSLILSLLILLSFLASCKTAEDGETTADITTAPETESSVNLREHTLMTDAFGNEFYADDNVDRFIASSTLYSLAGEPDFVTEEYLDFYYAFFSEEDEPIQNRELGTYWDMSSHCPDEYSLATEWAQMHGVVFIGDIIYGGPPSNFRYKYEWYGLSGNITTRRLGKSIVFLGSSDHTRGDIIMSLYFCAEEMGLDLTARTSIEAYSDSVDIDATKEGLTRSNYSPHGLPDTEPEKLTMDEYWSWAEACGMIVWDEEGKINQNELVTRGELSAMVDAFMNHYGIER